MDKLRLNGISTTDDYRLNSIWKNNAKTTQDVYKEVVIDMNKTIITISFALENKVNGKNSFLVETNVSLCGDTAIFQIREYYFNGDCVTLRIPKCLSKAGILEIAMFFTQDMHIFIHHKGK